MDRLEIFKALSNEMRLQMLEWLKEPEKNFPPQGMHLPEGEQFEKGVCVGSICTKANLSQSTVSHYLDLLQRVGLVESKRCGKWTYYRRNEKTIQELAKDIEQNL